MKTEELLRRDAEARILRETFSDEYAVLGVETVSGQELTTDPKERMVFEAPDEDVDFVR